MIGIGGEHRVVFAQFVIVMRAHVQDPFFREEKASDLSFLLR